MQTAIGYSIEVSSKRVAICGFMPNGHDRLWSSCKDKFGRILTVEDVVCIEPIRYTECDENLPYFSSGESSHFVAWLSERVVMNDF